MTAVAGITLAIKAAPGQLSGIPLHGIPPHAVNGSIFDASTSFNTGALTSPPDRPAAPRQLFEQHDLGVLVLGIAHHDRS